ncbi:MAG: hypothetical protein EP330_06755 [Deltaproteobacteria bacterium]|nr:MAG: hypothetical protein EP330_06755 [Deltaproteobacteria bacterium]
MRCRAVQERLVAWRDGELAPGEAVRVEEHVAGCVDCRVLDEHLLAATPEPFLDIPPISAEAEARLARMLDETTVDAPALMWQPEVDWRRLAPHALWAAAVLLCLGWGLTKHYEAQALQAQLDAAPAPAETVLGEGDFRPASWAPSETQAEPGE